MAALAAVQLFAQQATPQYQTITCVKARPDKLVEYRDFLIKTGTKIGQVTVDSGRYQTLVILEIVRPSGTEARCDFLLSQISAGAPPEPSPVPQDVLDKAGVQMTAEQYYARQAELRRVVSAETWFIDDRVGASKQGNYVYINWMKVKDQEAHDRFEKEIWSPVAAALVEKGTLTAWLHASRVAPSGSDLPYAAYTADIFPDWASVFKPWDLQGVFQKVHPGKNINETFSKVGSIREIGRKELFRVIARVSKQ